MTRPLTTLRSSAASRRASGTGSPPPPQSSATKSRAAGTARDSTSPPLERSLKRLGRLDVDGHGTGHEQGHVVADLDLVEALHVRADRNRPRLAPGPDKGD